MASLLVKRFTQRVSKGLTGVERRGLKWVAVRGRGGEEGFGRGKRGKHGWG